MALLSDALLLIHSVILLLSILVSVETNPVPGEVEEAVHVLKAAAASLGNGEPDPETADKGDGSKAPEGTLGGDTTLGDREEHVGNSTGVAVLVGKVKSHGPRGGKGTDAEREQLSGEEVLHRVPAKSPTEARDVDHGNGTTAGTLVLVRQDIVLIDSELGDTSEEAGDVDHGNGLEGDTNKESTLAANNIDEEESTHQGSNKLDNTEDGGDEETLLAAGDAHNLKQVRGIESDGTGTRPLGEELDHAGEVKTVEVAGDKEHLLELAEEADTLGSLELVVKSSLDDGDVLDDVVTFRVLAAKATEDLGGLLGPALLDEETGRLKLEEAQDEDDAREDDVQAGRYQPLVVCVIGEVDVAAVVGEVGEDDTKVDGTSEAAGGETTDRGGSDFSDVNRPKFRVNKRFWSTSVK